MARLKDQYNNEILAQLKDEGGYKNKLEVPRIEKIVVNVGVGRNAQDSKALEAITGDLAKITGQKPKENSAKKSIAGFKLREVMKIGATVTLRNDRMYEFLDRLINVTLPRVRDFRGISNKAFDGKGNYSLGMKDHSVFPEVSMSDNVKSFSLQINIVTTAKTDEEAKTLLTKFNFPFKK